jgi:heat shock protein HtpX
MIAALEKLKAYVRQKKPTPKEEALQTFKISTPTKHGWAILFSSHPPLEMRIEALRK